MIASLRALIRILDGIGGYMTHEDQQALWTARELAADMCYPDAAHPSWPDFLARNLTAAAGLRQSFNFGMVYESWLADTGPVYTADTRNWHPGCGRSVVR